MDIAAGSRPSAFALSAKLPLCPGLYGAYCGSGKQNQIEVKSWSKVINVHILGGKSLFQSNKS